MFDKTKEILKKINEVINPDISDGEFSQDSEETKDAIEYLREMKHQGIKPTSEEIQQAKKQNEAHGLNNGDKLDDQDRAILAATRKKEITHWQDKENEREKTKDTIIQKPF